MYTMKISQCKSVGAPEVLDKPVGCRIAYLLRHKLVSTQILGSRLFRRFLLQKRHFLYAYLGVIDTLIEAVTHRSRRDEH